MFWKFNLISTSHIETILNKENVTLQELMDEDDILQECKAQNKNLIDFLIRPEIMEEMVNLIINEPIDDLDEKVRYKYPNTACELLTSDVQQINDSLASDETLLAKLYSFLEAEKPLNPLLASFFSKTMGILITRKTEVILEFLKTKEDFVTLLINHLSTSAIMDLLLRLVTCVESGKLRTQVLNWLNDQQIIQHLVALIDPTSDEERHSNASQSLADIIRFAREQMAQLQEKADPDPLLQTIESSEVVTELLNHMFHASKNESALVNGIAVLLALLEFKKQGANNQIQTNEQSSLYFRPETHEQMTALDAERMAMGVNRSLTSLRPRLKEFHHLLLDPPHKNPIPTTIGTLEQPLGNTRIHIARLLSSALCANSHEINVDIATLGTMDILLDLFFKYTWNNFLHTQVEQCIGTILSNPPTETEGKQEHPLLLQLFSQCSLVQRILDAWEDNEQQQARPGGNRRGYMGHLTKIANHIAQNAEKGATSDLIQEQLKDVQDDYRQKWETFSTTTLSEVNKKNQVSLVGGHPLQSSSEDDDSDFRDIPFPQDTALQQMQQMTSNFIDQFGFNDDEFGDQEENLNGPLERLATVSFNISAEENARNADLFEQACNERIQPFDDADSDEDIWEDKVQDIGFANVTPQPSIVPAGSHRPTRASSDSTDSDEEPESPTTPVAPVIPSVPAPEEMKMEVDQNDPWTATFDGIPMDTGNPWETTAAPPVQQQDAGWANFSEFGNFSQLSAVASNSPVAMETSEATEASFKYLADSGTSSVARTERPPLALPPPPLPLPAPDDELPVSTAGPLALPLPALPPAEEETLEVPEIQKTEVSAQELADNFDFLASAGLLKPTSDSSSRPTESPASQENGPVVAIEAAGDLSTDQSHNEDARSKAKEAFDKLNVTSINATSNGPV